MTRALCSRSSKRKLVKSSQEVIPEDCKENSPSILSQSTAKKILAKNINHSSLEEKISPMETSSSLPKSTNANSNKEIYSPVRKSVRHLKSTSKAQNNPIKLHTGRSVLSDKTNSPRIRVNKTPSCETLTLPNKKNDSAPIITIPKPSEPLREDSLLKDETSQIKTHVPIYKNKTVGSLQTSSESEYSQPEKIEAVYEFEVDENEEPVIRRKRKKRTYVRKPKMGPKALTINNIKYSSSESLVSLSEKPIAQRKRTTKEVKSNLKSFSSVTNLNEVEDTSYSVKSFMSHPHSLILCENKKNKSRRELSVLQETQSEEYQSPVHQINVHVDFHIEPPIIQSPNLHSTVNEHGISKVSAFPSWHDIHFSPNPRCYVSRTSHTSNLNINSFSTSHQNNTIPHQISFCSPNISTSSSRDFLSSTPCKRMSRVVCDNSAFDDSGDLPRGLRPSTGLIKDTSADVSTGTSNTDNCFGFDEPYELEEPLVSPIKNNINLESKQFVRVLPLELPIRSNQTEKPKPNIQEVIQMLKSTIPKDTFKEASTVFDTSSERNNSSSPTNVDEDALHPTVNFKKPPRRSYERQRRIRHHSEHEEAEQGSSEEEKENVPKAVKICYKKKNTSKTSKPKKVTKAQQKTAKEEDEIERLAAEMNAKFQEIEKVNLVVE